MHRGVPQTVMFHRESCTMYQLSRDDVAKLWVRTQNTRRRILFLGICRETSLCGITGSCTRKVRGLIQTRASIIITALGRETLLTTLSQQLYQVFTTKQTRCSTRWLSKQVKISHPFDASKHTRMSSQGVILSLLKRWSSNP